MVQRLKISLILVFSIGVLTNGFSLQLGIYHQLYEVFLDGYEVNELASFPTHRIYELWEGEWGRRSIRDYEYKRDSNGNVVEVSEYERETGQKKIYTYTYKGNHLINIDATRYTLSGDLRNHYWLDITYDQDKIVEEYFKEGSNRLESQHVYYLDSKNRIVRISAFRWNGFSNTLAQSFDWKIEYKECEVSAVHKDFLDDEVQEETYDYSRPSVVSIIKDGGRRTEICYEGDRIDKVIEYTPNGENSARIIDYAFSEEGKLKTVQTYSGRAGEEYVVQYGDRRTTFIYE